MSNYTTIADETSRNTDATGATTSVMDVTGPSGEFLGSIAVRNPPATPTVASSAGSAAGAAASATSTASAGASGSTNFRYIPEPKQSKPEEINTQVVNTVTPNLENQQAGLAALRSMNILSRLSRDEFTFSSNRLGNIAGYCTYLKNASSEKGLYAAKIKDAKTS